MPKVTIHDFRLTDKVLAEIDPEAGDVVYLGPRGDAAYPFVAWRRLSGPGGFYVDACHLVSADGDVVAATERTYELDGESVVQDFVDEFRGATIPGGGDYTLRYYVYDDHVLDIPVRVVQQHPPYGALVPGPIDAALSKSTIAWLAVPQEDGSEVTKPIWYGYEEGQVYVLTGPAEQEIPGLTRASGARLIVRSKDVQSRVGDVECIALVLAKDGEWERIARDVMIGRRLNLRDGEGAVDRWKKTCEMVQLTPLPPASPA